MVNSLYLIEGLPCSGKSTTAGYAASILKQRGKCRFVDEGTGDHPADYEFHALAPAGLLSETEQIVKLSDYSGEMFDQLLQHKIYDVLPWEKEMPLMLERWRQFVRRREENTVYVFNCVFLQNPMCETMMRLGFSEAESEGYIRRIAEIIKPMNPIVLYLKNDDIAHSIHSAAQERPGWLEGVIDYHVNGAYGKRIGAEGFYGYIQCLEERQAREMRILTKLPVCSYVLDNPQRDWKAARKRIQTILMNTADGPETTQR